MDMYIGGCVIECFSDFCIQRMVIKKRQDSVKYLGIRESG